VATTTDCVPIGGEQLPLPSSLKAAGSEGAASTAMPVTLIGSRAAELGVDVLVSSADGCEGLQRSHLAYDKAGEEHYNIISALHKSVRGGDDNAALYWLARMLQGALVTTQTLCKIIVLKGKYECFDFQRARRRFMSLVGLFAWPQRISALPTRAHYRSPLAHIRLPTF
jgi:hypothetical protein